MKQPRQLTAFDKLWIDATQADAELMQLLDKDPPFVALLYKWSELFYQRGRESFKAAALDKLARARCNDPTCGYCESREAVKQIEP